MNAHLSYFIDTLEIRLKSAKAAHDWNEVDILYTKLQELYHIQETSSVHSKLQYV